MIQKTDAIIATQRSVEKDVISTGRRKAMASGERWETTPGRPAPAMSVARETRSRRVPHYLPEVGRFTWPLVGLPATACGSFRSTFFS